MEVQEHPLSSVRIRRQYLGIGAEQMADRLGMKRTSYLRFERGERRAYLDHAHAIATMLGCTVDQLRLMPTADEVKDLYARAHNPHPTNHTEPDEPAGAQLNESEPTPESISGQPIGTVVDAHDAHDTLSAAFDAQPAATAPASDDVAALVETWDNE